MREELRRAFDLTSDNRKEMGLALPDAAAFSAAIDRLSRSANAPEAGVWTPDQVAELWHALFDLEEPLSAFVAWHGEGGAPRAAGRLLDGRSPAQPAGPLLRGFAEPGESLRAGRPAGCGSPPLWPLTPTGPEAVPPGQQ